ncbi:MAG: hypothetical protein NZM31_03410 [Gemmatales bacterium]|nr:hypothetical protein [Gemmatales bacterium]MDW8386046.1 hypothetical protein [Gemmatales bacterium]
MVRTLLTWTANVSPVLGIALLAFGVLLVPEGVACAEGRNPGSSSFSEFQVCLCWLRVVTATPDTQTILEEAERHWIKLEGFWNNVEGAMTIERERIVGQQEKSAKKLEFLIAYPLALCKEIDENGQEDVKGYNSRYYFHIRRANSTSPYVLLGTSAPTPLLKGQVWPNISTSKAVGLRDHESLFISQWKTVPHFTWSSALKSANGNNVVLKAQYRPPGITRPPIPRPYDVEFTLDPRQLWSIIRCDKTIYMPQKDRTLANPFGHFYEVEYTEKSDPIPLPKRVTVWFWSGGDRTPTVKETITFIRLTPRKASEAEFTLSAFGLPEPPGVTWERPTPWWLYGIAVGFALVVLSGILYRIVNRLRSRGIKTRA